MSFDTNARGLGVFKQLLITNSLHAGLCVDLRGAFLLNVVANWHVGLHINMTV